MATSKTKLRLKGSTASGNSDRTANIASPNIASPRAAPVNYAQYDEAYLDCFNEDTCGSYYFNR